MKKVRALLVTPYHEAVNEENGPAVAVTYALAFPDLAPHIKDIEGALYSKLFHLRGWAIAQGASPDKMPTVPALYGRYMGVMDGVEDLHHALNAFTYTKVTIPPRQWLTGTLGAVKGHLRSVG